MGEEVPEAVKIFSGLGWYPHKLLDGTDDLLSKHRAEIRQRVVASLRSWKSDLASQDLSQITSAIENLGVELVELVAWQLSYVLV